VTAELPWRGPGEDRPDLPLPPEKMPMRRGGRRLKKWLYVAAFAEEVMVAGLRVEVGRMGQTFWVILDRESGEMHENTRLRPPGARGEVWTEDEMFRIMRGKNVRANLRPGEGNAIEAVCPTPDGEYVWTRKVADIPVEMDVRVDGKKWKFEARGIRDESAGYHPRHTVWSWSAGVGRTTDGRSVGWNLVSGINDPAENSERAVWVDGRPSEPAPVTFEDLDTIWFDDGARLGFQAEAERTKEQNLMMVRYSYRQPFGHFSGTLPGGLEIEHALGVMEHHDAHW
jgi:Protein of unknown function (DUF2804)